MWCGPAGRTILSQVRTCADDSESLSIDKKTRPMETVCFASLSLSLQAQRQW